MFSIEEFIIAVFCCVDDWLEEITQGHRNDGNAPSPNQRNSAANQEFETGVWLNRSPSTTDRF